MIKLPYNSVAAEQHFNLIKDIIRKRAKTLARKGIKRKNEDIKPDASTKAYLDSLQDDKVLKPLIIGRIKDLATIIAGIRHKHPDFLKPRSHASALIKNLFVNSCYDNQSFSKLDFINRIQVDTCPYCNRSYIYSLDKQYKIKPQIDHFYPKSKYPFLGMSFYNLIPACQTCNSPEVKGETDPVAAGLTNPYEIDPNDFEFSWRPLRTDFLNRLADKKSIALELTKKIPGHNKIFKLEEMYKMHSDHVLELLIKSKVEYTGAFTLMLNAAFPTCSFTQNEIQRLVIGNYVNEDEIHKRPLAKLYKDIAMKEGLISRSL